MTDKQLSPAAQAIVDAYESTADKYKALAAVLQSIADKVAPEFWYEEGDIYGETLSDVRSQLLSIVEELEQF